jgi:hypothetical protein
VSASSISGVAEPDLNVSRLIESLGVTSRIFSLFCRLEFGDETGHTTLRRLSGTFPSHHYHGKPDIEGGPDRPSMGKV